MAELQTIREVIIHDLEKRLKSAGHRVYRRDEWLEQLADVGDA